MLRPILPMLAKAGKLTDLDRADIDNYVIEPKYDGIRCQLVRSNGVTQLYNRRLVNITDRFPDVVALFSRLPYDVILDGEIIVYSPSTGLPDFQRVQHRANRKLSIAEAVRDYPADFAVFDIMYCKYAYVGTEHLWKRRMYLQELYAHMSFHLAPYLVSTSIQHGVGEGVMMKDKFSLYEDGVRSAAWLKVKWPRVETVTVGGVSYGLGKRASTFGNLLCGKMLPNGKLRYTGAVGTGFTDAELQKMYSRLSTIKTDTNPFMENARDWGVQFFCAPLLNIQVAFQEYTKDGIMRFPRYVGVD